MAGDRADSSSNAISLALAALQREREAVEARRAELLAIHGQALLDTTATAKEIGGMERAGEEAAADLRRLAAIEPQLLRQLAAAEAAEVAEGHRQATKEAREAFVASVRAYRAALPDYLAAAAEIVRVIELEKAMDTAGDRFQRAATAHLPFPRPILPPVNAGVDLPETGLATRTVLPGLGNEPMIYGSLPPSRAAGPVWTYG